MQLKIWRSRSGLSCMASAFELMADQQANSLIIPDVVRWLDGCESTRVLARSSRPVFPLVQEGSFTADLYYRLGTVLLLVR